MHGVHTQHHIRGEGGAMGTLPLNDGPLRCDFGTCGITVLSKPYSGQVVSSGTVRIENMLQCLSSEVSLP